MLSWFMKRYNFLYKWNFILFIFSLFFQSCKYQEGRKQHKKEYYDSGILKTDGWYINDSIPTDSVVHYYKNGN